MKQGLRLVIIRRRLVIYYGLFLTLAYLAGLALWQERAIQASVGSLAGKVVIIDPGHGGIDPGAVGYNGVLEKDVVLSISKYLKNFLLQAGAMAIMTREVDMDLLDLFQQGKIKGELRDELQMRVDVANENHGDVFLSIHANAHPSRWEYGAQAFYYPSSHPDNRRLAETIQAELKRLAGPTDREANFYIDQYVLKRVKMPSATVEVGFLSNPTEEKMLADPEYQQKMAWAIFVALARFFHRGAVPGPE